MHIAQVNWNFTQTHVVSNKLIENVNSLQLHAIILFYTIQCHSFAYKNSCYQKNDQKSKYKQFRVGWFHALLNYNFLFEYLKILTFRLMLWKKCQIGDNWIGFFNLWDDLFVKNFFLMVKDKRVEPNKHDYILLFAFKMAERLVVIFYSLICECLKRVDLIVFIKKLISTIFFGFSIANLLPDVVRTFHDL